MAAGRSADEPFWDNYRGYSNHRSGRVANCTEVDVHARTHTCCLLTLKAHPSWHIKKMVPPPLKQFNCSLIAFIILLIQISAISSRCGRYAYHELFWHRDLLIFASNISSYQSVPGVVVGRLRVRGWDTPPHPHPLTPSRTKPNHSGDNNELWPQLWAACVRMHLIKACRREERAPRWAYTMQHIMDFTIMQIISWGFHYPER